MSKKKQLQLLLTTTDEATLSSYLREEISGIIFLDDNVWNERPKTEIGIEECHSGRVYLCQEPLNALPTRIRHTGEIEGPIAGCVIQILRSRLRDSVLDSGRIAVGYEDADAKMDEFVQSVWRAVVKVGTFGVVRPDGKIDKHYLVGRDARRRVAKGLLSIRDRATGIPYEPSGGGKGDATL